MEVDLAKRRRIMQRSMKLGHCICDPKRPCPCNVFTDDGICLCAGERPEPVDISQVRLTELVHNAGCASKIAAADLEAVLKRLPPVDDPAVLSGIPTGDDAGVYALTEGVTLVQTVDVFTPCVDDPEMFGRICAVNCLSDIYAMGGVPRTALSIMCFPVETQDGAIMYHMLKGAMDVLSEAGVALLGGHSIKDSEIKLGFAITGTIDADAIEHGTAGVGDMLVLTKPLGVGVLTFARQIGRVESGQLAEVEASMATLNRSAAEAMTRARASACTDVTGFGLFGHLIAMARQSHVTAQIWADALPAFDGAVAALADGVVPGAIERNREYVADDITVADGVDEALVDLGFDAQTSGGLLIAIPADRHESLLAELAKRGVAATTVGEIVAESRGAIAVTLSGQDAGAAPQIRDHNEELPAAAKALQPCCTDPPAQEAKPCCEATAPSQGAGISAAGRAAVAFGDLMAATGAAGEIDAKTKELINYALSVGLRCEPCIRHHTEAALAMGITQKQLDEATWCAVAMGGAPVRMFHQQAMSAPGGDDKGCCP